MQGNLFINPNTPSVARSTDPVSSHQHMADLPKSGKKARVLSALRQMDGWRTTAEVARHLNRRPEGGLIQERDVSRIFTTLWREHEVIRQHRDGDKVLEFIIPAHPFNEFDPRWYQPVPEKQRTADEVLTERIESCQHVEIHHLSYVRYDGHNYYLAEELLEALTEGLT